MTVNGTIIEFMTDVNDEHYLFQIKGGITIIIPGNNHRVR